ncbi:MAG: O-antigen ligase family protein [Corynebacteriales bacterium]|nr:O-antigen ligase family protein [Mycobacteriales bacterium]
MSLTYSAVPSLRFYPLWLLAAMFAFAALGNRAVPGAPLGIQVTHLACGAAICAVAWWHKDALADLQFPPALWWAAGYVVASVLASAVSATPDKSIKITATMCIGLALAAAIVTVVTTVRHQWLLAMAATVGSFFATIPAIAAGKQLATQLDGAVINNRPTGAFSDPNTLGTYCALMMLLALSVLLFSDALWQKIIAGSAALAAGAALALSMSRGAWIGAALGLLVLCVAHRGARRLLTRVGLITAVVIVGAMTVAPANSPLSAISDRAASIGDPSANPYDVRPLTWREATRQFIQSPFLGHGPGSFRVLSAQSPSSVQFYPRQHAHNGILTVLAETGVAGLAPLVGLFATLGWALARGIRQLRRADDQKQLALLAGVLAALVALTGHLMVDYTLRNPTLLLTVWALLGLAIASGRNANDLPQ